MQHGPGDRIPDPAALVQGHALMRAARGLMVPAVVCGGLAALALVLVSAIQPWRVDVGAEKIALGLVLFAIAAWLLRSPRRPPQPQPIVRTRLPRGVEGLLVLLESLIDMLERGHDRDFDLEAAGLGHTLAGLDAHARQYLDERGADPARLRACMLGSDADIVVRFDPDQRRSLHQELVRFVAAARGRPCGDPYRANIGAGPPLLGALRDPALRRARRALAVGAVVLGGAWFALWIGSAVSLDGRPVTLCWSSDERCQLAFGGDELALAGVLAIAALPIFGILAGVLHRGSAWASWAAALPEDGRLAALADASPSFAAARRRQFDRRTSRRWLAGFAVGALLCWIPFVGHALVGAASSLDDPGMLGRFVLAVELFALGLVAVGPLVRAAVRRLELRGVRRRSERASPVQAGIVSELVADRFELADAEPPRAEQLSQLASVLAGVELLGELDADDRDRVVARLRAAASRGPALRRDQRDELLLELETCEALILAR